MQEKKKFLLSGRLSEYNNAMIGTFHWHENLEICRIVNNSCKFVVEGKTICANPGDVVVFDEYMAHQFILESENTEIYIIQMNLNCFVNQEVPLTPVKMHITNEEINKVPELSRKIDELIGLIISEVPARENVSENPFMHSLLAALYYLLVRYFPEDAANDKNGRNEFYKIIEYINNHYTEDISAETISKFMFVSPKAVASLFRKFSGMGINDYVNYLRIKAANNMILHGESVTVAAFACGFRSIRTFNDVYKKNMNVTPSEYLKSNIKK